MKKTTRKTPTKTQTAPQALPLELTLLAATIMERDPDELRLALSAAREALESVTEGPEDCHNRISEYIRIHAEERGPCADGVQKALAADPGNLGGDLYTGYATPGLLAGLSLAWLILRGEGGTR